MQILIKTVKTSNMKLFYFLLLFTFSFLLQTQTAKADDLIKVELVGNNNCNGQLEVGIWVRASAFATSDFEIGTSSLFFNFDPAVVTYSSYNEVQFSATATQGTTSNWADQRIDVHPGCGLISLVLQKKEGGSNNYLLSKDEPILVGKIEFDILTANTDPGISLNGGFTSFNSSMSNDGTVSKTLEDYPILTDYACCSNGAVANVGLKAMLGGPYNNSTQLMNDDLRNLKHIPYNDPYVSLGFDYINYNDGSSMINPTTALANKGIHSIVDWVFLKVYNVIDPTMIVTAQPALIKRNGEIVSLDGQTPIRFANFNSCTFSIAIYHRNHLGIQTKANGVSFSQGGSNLLDFTSASVQLEASTQNDINGVYALFPGDANFDASIDAADRSIVWNARNTTGYLSSDVSLDGFCDASDRSFVWNFRNKSGVQLP